MTVPQSVPLSWSATTCLIVLWGTISQADDAATYDCGTLSLYTILRLEGKPTSLIDLENRLQTTPARGYSMKQLREASLNFGLDLEGIHWEERVLSPDRPIIAFVKRGQHGHFLVIRPVGVLGRMVQVFDNDHEAEVIDMSELTASSGWTGLILRPTHVNWSLRISVASLLMAAVLSCNLVRRRLRHKF